MALGDGLWVDGLGDGMATTGQGAESSPEIQSPTMSIIFNQYKSIILKHRNLNRYKGCRWLERAGRGYIVGIRGSGAWIYPGSPLTSYPGSFSNQHTHNLHLDLKLSCRIPAKKVRSWTLLTRSHLRTALWLVLGSGWQERTERSEAKPFLSIYTQTHGCLVPLRNTFPGNSVSFTHISKQLHTQITYNT